VIEVVFSLLSLFALRLALLRRPCPLALRLSALALALLTARTRWRCAYPCGLSLSAAPAGN
jgi:hypothetical protein